jgi:AraC-like DNA-binding protein
MRLIDGVSPCDPCIGEVSVTYGTRPAGRTVQTPCRKTHGLCFLRRGSAAFWSEGTPPTRAEAGSLVFLPKYQSYRMQFLEDGTVFVLINFELFLRDGTECTLSREISVLLRRTESPTLEHVMSVLEKEAALGGLAADLRRKELLLRLLSYIYEASSHVFLAARRESRILPGLRLLEQTYSESLPIEVFADACGMSVSSFRSHFHKMLGVSPVEYRNRLRIERARAMLSENGCSVTEAAYACGFENLGYFCKYYKKITGESPGSTKRNL